MFHPTIIASGMYVKGTLNARGDCVIYGTIEGDIFSDESVIIEESGFVKGHISAPALVIKGRCDGIIHCDIVKILPYGHMKGSIESAVFMMYPKALFEGIKTTVEKRFDTQTQESTKPTEFDTENILL